MSIIGGIIAPGLPHPLLVPEQNEGWARIRAGFEEAQRTIERLKPDVLVFYSTMWPSILGHQVQARKHPQWTHVDELFHDLGSIPYRFDIDVDLADELVAAGDRRGLQMRRIDYEGFPIDTGTVTCWKLLNGDNQVPGVVLSSNIYADRQETVVLAKALNDALTASNKRAVIITVMTLSNRLFTDFIDPKDDRIHSEKDDEWNRKLLAMLKQGRLEDVSQLSRMIQEQVRVAKVVNFKPLWWMSAAMGNHNRYQGEVLAYEALYGTGGAVVTLTPSEKGMGHREFDEDDVEVFRGDREVLSE